MYMNFVVLALCVCVWAKWFLIIALFPSQVARVTCYKKHSTFAYIFSIPIRLVEKILRGGGMQGMQYIKYLHFLRGI